MRYLKEKLIADLENPEKIFVLKAAWAPVPAADIEALGQAIRSYGPGELLCVSAADQDHAAGEIMPAAPGVFIGYLDFSGTLDLAARQPEWLALCRTMRGMSVVCNHN
jgi:hypothetical protein